MFNIFETLKNFWVLKNFKHLLISIPKCTELNSESEPFLGLVYV